jgi:hypothetical protein
MLFVNITIYFIVFTLNILNAMKNMWLNLKKENWLIAQKIVKKIAIGYLILLNLTPMEAALTNFKI